MTPAIANSPIKTAEASETAAREFDAIFRENLRPELLLQGQWLDESSMLMPWFRRGVSHVQSST